VIKITIRYIFHGLECPFCLDTKETKKSRLGIVEPVFDSPEWVGFDGPYFILPITQK
jgi:hypothetical protein